MILDTFNCSGLSAENTLISASIVLLRGGRSRRQKEEGEQEEEKNNHDVPQDFAEQPTRPLLIPLTGGGRQPFDSLYQSDPWQEKLHFDLAHG